MTYGDGGEVFIFTDAAQEGQKRRGPSRRIVGATVVDKLGD